MHDITERTPLTRRTDSSGNIEYRSFLRNRKNRIRQFQCCICGILIALFTMILVVSISYSMRHTNTTASNDQTMNNDITFSNNSNGILRLKLSPESASQIFYNDIDSTTNDLNSFLIPYEDTTVSTNSLTHEEFMYGLQAGKRAMKDRLSADIFARQFPLLSPSPESRHRYSMNTCPNVGALALAAVAEIAATKKIENMRSIHNKTSAMNTFFDGGWVSNKICKQFYNHICKINKYRIIDGTCNRLKQWGSSLTPFRRVLPPDYSDGIDLPRRAKSGKELPSAREVSLKVHKPSDSNNPSFTVMLAVFGQFLDHDITATALSQGVNGSSIACCSSEQRHPECFPVRIDTDDPINNLIGKSCMDFVRSAPAPQCKLGPREQLNQVSAFIDGSAIYGSDNETARDLREFIGGRLKMQYTPDNRTLLPPSTNPNDGCNRETERLRGRYCFAAGDARANENLHLTTMHLLWARQHNRIADQLANLNPTWSDEILYQETRRIIGAQLQHITYSEFLPIVLGDKKMKEHKLKPLKTGYRKWRNNSDDLRNDPTIANHFAAAAFRFAHTLLPGLMKITDVEKNTSAYIELHKMLFNPYNLYTEKGSRDSVNSAMTNVIQKYSTHVTSQLTNHLFEDPVSNSTPACGLDLVSLNIQRGRDHGLPGYIVWREYCGLGKVKTFDELEGYLDHSALEQISILYESVEDIDLYTGALAEIPKFDSLVGPTFTCLIADQFIRLQKGDRFWYEIGEQPHSFTIDQLLELRKSSLAKIICDCSDGITHAQIELMRSAGPHNPIVSCDNIPGPSFSLWKKNHDL